MTTPTYPASPTASPMRRLIEQAMRQFPVRARRAVAAAATVVLSTALGSSAAAQADPAQKEPPAKQPTWARTIYVDYDDGNDEADGATPGTARRTIPPQDRLGPGVRVLFKGGVRYPAPARITRSGAPGNPIVYDGNADNEWGEGRAIVEGAGTLGPWREAGRTEDGLTIWEADLPAKFDWINKNFRVWQDDKPLRVASSADLKDNLMIAEFKKYWHGRMKPTKKGSTIEDPKHLAPLGDGWKHTAICYHGRANHTYMQEATGFDTQTSTLHLKKLAINPGGITYAVLNHPGVFDARGEFLVRPDKKTIRLIPLMDTKPGPGSVRYTKRGVGIVNRTSSHILIRGFRITGTSWSSVWIGKRGASTRPTDVRLVDYEVVGSGAVVTEYASDITIEHGNLMEVGGKRPIFVDRCHRVRVAWNRLRRTQSGITAFAAKNSLFLGNDVRQTLDIHGNAMTVYVGSHKTWIVGNTLAGGRAGTGLTLRNSNNLIIAFNTIHGGPAFGQWAEPKAGSPMTICNNTIFGSFLIRPASVRRSELFNNFIRKYHRGINTAQLQLHSHNIYEIGGAQGGGKTSMVRKRNELFRGRLGRPSPEGWKILAHGRKHRLPIAPGGIEANYIGARNQAGELPDLSAVTIPAKPAPDKAPNAEKRGP